MTLHRGCNNYAVHYIAGMNKNLNKFHDKKLLHNILDRQQELLHNI
jgi:hypothetical protein